MLKSLMKYELRATARIMLPLYLATLLLALGTRLSGLLMPSFPFQDTILYQIAEIFFFLMSVGFAIALAAVFLVSLVLSVLRFRSNLLGDEGYVMFTLPVSVHQLVWSKLLVSILWFAASVVIDWLACALAILKPFMLSDIQDLFSALAQPFQGVYLHGLIAAAELCLLFLVAALVLCLQFYTPLAIGHSFDRHKMLLSVVCFFGIQIALQIAGTILIANGFTTLSLNLSFSSLIDSISVTTMLHGTIWAGILSSGIVGVVLYCITIYMLHRKLNLE